MAVFRVPCNWDPKLLDALDRSATPTLYGMLPSHSVGGGRPSAALPHVSKEQAEEYIRAVKAKGLSFNYLFNAPCLDAQEFTDSWRSKFLNHLEWTVGVGVDAVTVAVPYLIEVIKKHSPHLKVCVSSFARVNSLRRALYFEALGADDITVDPISMTRDLRCLEALAKRLKCQITLIANSFCLYQCPFAEYHSVLMGHSSQEKHPSGGRYEEYPFYNCTLRKLTNPSELVRAGFIRPEDIRLYEEIGIESFKLTDRTRPTPWLAKAVAAYVEGSYKGDLLQILNFPHSYLSWLFSQFGLEGKPAFPVLDNENLDGFLERVAEQNCREQDCDACGVCREYAERAVRFPDGINKLVRLLESACVQLNFG